MRRARIVGVISFVVLALPGPAAFATSQDEPRDVAARIPEVAAVLESTPGSELVGGPADGGNWVFEIIADDREIGFVVLSPDLDLVEMRLDEQVSDDDDQGPASALADLIPRPEGAAFLWATVGLVVFILWPDGSWSGRLLVITLVVWGGAWFLFWRSIALAQATLWITICGMGWWITAGLARGKPPQLAARGQPRLFAVGLGLVGAWLAWLALTGAAVEDSAIWGARGGRFLVDHCAFPYGVLGEGATYGPVQYMLHAPLTVLWPPDSGTPFTAARTVALLATAGLAFGAVGVLSRTRRYPGAVAVMALPWFVSVVDVANVSQLVPITLTVWAAVLVTSQADRRIVTGGALLGIGAGAMFVPAFAAPALLVAARSRWRLVLAGMVGAGSAVLIALVMAGTDPATFWNDTVRFQETTYAAAGGFSVWGQFGFERWRWLGKAVHLGLIAGSVAGLRRNPSRGAALLAAGVGIAGALLWKGHVGPWGYLTWFVPLLVLGGMLAGDETEAAREQQAELPLPWRPAHVAAGSDQPPHHLPSA